MLYILNLTTPKGTYLELVVYRTVRHGTNKTMLVLDIKALRQDGWADNLAQFIEAEEKAVRATAEDTTEGLASLIAKARKHAASYTERGLKGQWREGEDAWQARKNPFKVDSIGMLFGFINSVK